MLAEKGGQTAKVVFDHVLCAIGRSPNVSGYGIEEMGIALSANKAITTNPFLQTNYPNIFAVGDVTGPFQFTHTAAHQAWYAAVNALFGDIKKFKADYSVIPWATFTEPEIARVGLNEQEAKAQGIAYEVTRYDLDDLDRAIADGEAPRLRQNLDSAWKGQNLGRNHRWHTCGRFNSRIHIGNEI